MNVEPKDIVEEYLLILEKRKDYGMAMPLSLLSHSKTEIKEAIKAVILTIENVEERDKLKAAYMTLSEFLPDAVFARVIKDWKDVADAECEVNQESEMKAETDVMAEVVAVQKSIADEGAQLSQEIADFISKIE